MQYIIEHIVFQDDPLQPVVRTNHFTKENEFMSAAHALQAISHRTSMYEGLHFAAHKTHTDEIWTCESVRQIMAYLSYERDAEYVGAQLLARELPPTRRHSMLDGGMCEEWEIGDRVLVRHDHLHGPEEFYWEEEG